MLEATDLQHYFLAIAFLCGCLLLGMVLRARLSFFQAGFLPASVIGGFFALLLGPEILGRVTMTPLPDSWIAFYTLLPGLLIIPIVAAVPLGLSIGKGTSRVMSRDTWNMVLLFLVMVSCQLFAGGLIGAFFLGDAGLIYQHFGIEAALGFAGGHPMGGLIGGMYRDMGLDYWEIAQGLTVTYATVGLVGGIALGLLNFRRLQKRGQLIHAGAELPRSWVTGVEPDPEKRAVLGREVTHSASLDTLAFTLALIFAGSALAIGLKSIAGAAGLPVVSVIPVWGYAVLTMWGIWALLLRMGLHWIVDAGTKQQVIATLTDFAIVAAIASMPVQALLTYALPIVLISVLSLFMSWAIAFLLASRAFRSAAYERGMLLFGTGTGVFVTGILLLRMSDPEFKTDALRDGSAAYAISVVATFLLIPAAIFLGQKFGPLGISVGGGSLAILISLAVLWLGRGHR